MSRVIALVACGLSLGACSSSLPSLDFLRGSPATETLRIESEPPGADARTASGQTCRTPCELTVPAGAETSISLALSGFQPQTVPIRNEVPEGMNPSEVSPRLQPNPVYVELQPLRPAAPAKKPRKKRTTTARAKPPTAPPAQSQATAPDPNAAYPAGYPWPDPQPR